MRRKEGGRDERRKEGGEGGDERRKEGGEGGDERRKEGGGGGERENKKGITLMPDFCVYIQLLSMRTHTSIHNHTPFQDGKEGGGACHLGRLSGQPDHITHSL